MKKLFLWSIAILLSGMVLLLNPMDVKAENYYWAEAQETAEDGSVVRVPGWYKGALPASANSEKMTGAPDELTSADTIYVRCEPDEVCKEWFKSLSGNIGLKIYCYNSVTDIQIGNPDSEQLQLGKLEALNKGKMVVYADIAEIRFANLDVLEIYGNVNGKLPLGSTSTILQSSTISVSGNVEQIEWYRKENVFNAYIDAYQEVGFDGTVTVGGKVNAGAIYTTVYDEEIAMDTWHQTGAFGPCETGVCQINAGVLSENVTVTEIQPQLGNYKYNYVITNDGNCLKAIYDAETGKSVASIEWEIADIPDGAELTIMSTIPGETTIIEADLKSLIITLQQATKEADVIINGDVETLYTSCMRGRINAVINGDVTYGSVRVSPGADYNVFINGTIQTGTAIPQVSGVYELSKFTGSNLYVIEKGEIGTGIFLKKTLDSSSIGYEPLKNKETADALENHNIGKETTVTTNAGEKTIVKTAAVVVGETEKSTVDTLKETADMKKALEDIQNDAATENQTYTAEVINSLEINVNTYYEDKNTQKIFTDDPAYGTESVKELEEGKTLSFSIKVPENQYDVNATYTVVRNHVNADGTTSVDVLETTQEDDILTFASDKFSTFVIVKITEDEIAKEENYVYTFTCQDGTAGDGQNRWTKRANDAQTNEFIYSESCTIDDITENGNVIIVSTDEKLPVVIEKNLNELNVSANAESVVTIKGNVADVMIADLWANFNVTIEGNVEYMHVTYLYNEKNNLSVNGKVKEGSVRSERMPVPGYFDCSNMKIIENGKWNPELFIYASKKYEDTISYKPYQDEEMKKAMDGLDIGKEITIDTSTGENITITKTGSVSVSETKDDVFKNLSQSNDMAKILETIKNSNKNEQQVLDAKPVAALDITLRTYYVNKNTNVIYSDENFTTKEVTELTEGRTFAFSVKVPANKYDASATYTVIRNHVNADGTTSMDIIETTQEGDVLTFASDKFSTFVIVEMKTNDRPSQPTEPSAPTEPDNEQNSAETIVEETVIVGEQTVTTMPTETGDFNQYELLCTMLLGSIIAVIALVRKEKYIIK